MHELILLHYKSFFQALGIDDISSIRPEKCETKTVNGKEFYILQDYFLYKAGIEKNLLHTIIYNKEALSEFDDYPEYYSDSTFQILSDGTITCMGFSV